jgi:transposase
VARQADVTPSLIYRWRRRFQAAANGFARVLVAPPRDEAEAEAEAATQAVAAPQPTQVIELEVAGSARLRIPASIPPALATAVIEALLRR